MKQEISYISFNESDTVFVDRLTSKLCTLIHNIFDEIIGLEKDGANLNLNLQVQKVEDLPEKVLLSFLDILSDNLGSLYTRINGKTWKQDKYKEMQELGLVYIYYTNHTGEIVGFMSIMLTKEESLQVIFLYEIHCKKEYQGVGIGSMMLDTLVSLSEHLNTISRKELSQENTTPDSKEIKNGEPVWFEPSIFSNIGVVLNVFSANEGALKLYYSRNFVPAPFSYAVEDKVLRNGKIIKPDIYCLIRINESSKI